MTACNPPIRAIPFDREAWEVWLATRTPEHAAELRAGMEIIDYQESVYAQKDEETK